MNELPTSYKIGDEVLAGPGYPAHTRGVVYVVEKLPAGRNGVNYTAKPKDGAPGQPGIKGRAENFRPHDPDAPTTPSGAVVTTFQLAPVQGTIVTVSGVSKIDPTVLYVSLGEARKPDCTKIVKLGGEGARYWPAIPTECLTVIPVERITVAGE